MLVTFTATRHYIGVGLRSIGETADLRPNLAEQLISQGFARPVRDAARGDRPVAAGRPTEEKPR